MRELFQGFCMAMADSVPGVSGGTIAFLMGFYNRFIGSISDLISRDRMKRRKALGYLLKLAAGWAVGMGIAVTVLSSVFTSGIYEISSLFLGFIIASIVILYLEKKQVLWKHPKELVWMPAGALLVIGITVASRHAFFGNIDLAAITPAQGIYIFAAAAVSICAMVLPGISGSTLLLIFGLYLPVITAAGNILRLQLDTLPALCIFAAGMIAGILSCARGIRWLLNHYPGAVTHAIIGMMIGSLYAVVQGPLSLKQPMPAMTFSTFRFWFFLIGVMLVLLMERQKVRSGRRYAGKKRVRGEEAA